MSKRFGYHLRSLMSSKVDYHITEGLKSLITKLRLKKELERLEKEIKEASNNEIYHNTEAEVLKRCLELDDGKFRL
jgi:hypothetical protein